MNVTMVPHFSAICGITEHELVTAMKEDIGRLAQAYEVTHEEMHEKLKLRYDGYHFSEDTPEIYNPYLKENIDTDDLIIVGNKDKDVKVESHEFQKDEK